MQSVNKIQNGTQLLTKLYHFIHIENFLTVNKMSTYVYKKVNCKTYTYKFYTSLFNYSWSTYYRKCRKNYIHYYNAFLHCLCIVCTMSVLCTNIRYSLHATQHSLSVSTNEAQAGGV